MTPTTFDAGDSLLDDSELDNDRADPRGGGGGSLVRLTAMRQLMALMFLGVTSFFLTLSALPSWASHGGAGVELAGVVTTAMLACTVAVQLLVPAAVARFGTAAVLAVGLVLLGGPSPLYLLGQDVWWLSAVSTLRGAGFAVITVLGVTLTAQIAPLERRGEAIGLFGLAIALPNLLAVPIGVGLTLAGNFSWVAVAAMSPLLALPIVVPLVRRSDVHPSAHGTATASTPGTARPGVTTASRRLVSRRELIGVAIPSLLLLVVTLAGGGLTTFLPIERPHGYLAAAALAIFGASGALSRWVAGLIADRIGTRLLTPLALLTSAAGIAAVATGLAVASGSGADQSTCPGITMSDGIVLVAALVFGIGYGAIQNLTLLEALARASSSGLASSAWNACFDTGTALGAFAVGLVAGGLGIPGAYTLCALLIAAALPLALWLRARS